MPRGSLQIGLPCLEKYASSRVRTPEASSFSRRPSSINSRTACGSTLIPTPSGFSSDTLSKTLAEMPIWCRLSAKVSPPMPPPAISTVILFPFYVMASWHGSAAVGNCESPISQASWPRGWTPRRRVVTFARPLHEDHHAETLLCSRYLRARLAYCLAGGGCQLHHRTAGLQNQPAAKPAISRGQSEGARAGAGDRSRHPHRDAGDPRLHRPEFSASQAGPARGS